jgi:hypothetical protein
LGSTKEIKNIQVENLGNFLAYKNGGIKVVFLDRTIVNMNMHTEYATVLTSFGEQIQILLTQPIPFKFQK